MSGTGPRPGPPDRGQRKRNIALLVALLAAVGLFYFVAVVRMGQG